MPTVSVIIPTWNRPLLLRNALASVVRQTEQRFEALVIDDDGVHDTAEKIVQDLDDPRVHYMRVPEHRGVTALRNIGVAWARAPYIAFLDDDDEWLPEKLAVQLRVLEAAAPSVAGVYSARLTVYLNTGRTAVHRFPRPLSPWRGNPITTSSLLIRRSCFDICGMFDERLTAGEDWDMWVRMWSRFSFEYIDQVLVKYSIHTNSIEARPLAHASSRELILAKHAALFGRHPRFLSGRHKRLGKLYYRHGQLDDARRNLRTAIRIWPFAVDAYWALLLACLPMSRGRRTFADTVSRSTSDVSAEKRR